MSHKPLTTYLRTYRKRTGFSQEEVAFLLGTMSGTAVSRHEKGARMPVLATALAYEVVLGVSIRKLYEGAFFDAQLRVQVRARGLCRSLERRPKTSIGDRKIAVLKHIFADGEDSKAA
jgi:transcriptional regulator with XRE-family HTH domain